MRTYCIAQGTLLHPLWWHKWEGNPKERGYIYTCVCIADSFCWYSRHYYNIVKKLYNKNFKKKTAAHYSCPLLVYAEGNSGWEKQDEVVCALDIQSLDGEDAYLEKNFNDHRFLYLPLYRKALKSLTQGICSFWLAVIFYQDECLTTRIL